MHLNRIFIPMLIFALMGGGCRPKKESLDAMVADLGRPQNGDAAREQLMRVGPPAIPRLIEALNDPNPVIRTNAVWTLGGIPESRETTTPHLIAALDDSDGLFRSALIWELGRIGRPVDRLFPLFVRHLDDDYVRTRVNAADALVRMERDKHHRDVIIPLDKILQVLTSAMSESDVWPPCHAPPVLTALGPRARPAVPSLVQALNRSDLLVRIHAGRTLYRLEPHRAKQIVKAVTPALSAEGPWAAPAAVELLNDIDTPEAKEALKQHAAK